MISKTSSKSRNSWEIFLVNLLLTLTKTWDKLKMKETTKETKDLITTLIRDSNKFREIKDLYKIIKTCNKVAALQITTHQIKVLTRTIKINSIIILIFWAREYRN